MEQLQDFIKKYFSLLNLRNMPEAVLARYKKYIKDDDFPNKDVKSWTKLMNPGTTTWQNPPSFATLSDNEIDLLFKDLLLTFEAMNAHAKKLSGDTKDFLNNYFGNNKLFSIPDIPHAERNNILTLLNLVANDEVPVYLQWDEQPIIQEVLAGNKDVNNNTVKRVVFSIINQIKQAQQNGNITDEVQAKLAPLNLNHIQNIVNQEIQVTNSDRSKLRGSGAKIFETLFKKNKVFDDFQKYEPGEKFISEQINEALSNTDYTGKTNAKNYIPAKYEDKLNLRQQIEEKIDETYNDVLKKYLTLHRANVFIKPQAKAIFNALDDKKIAIKPTDGIEKILEKASDITNKLKGKQPFDAADHFKWMIEKLSDYKDHGMGKAIKAALHNGPQMRHIIEQLILDAVKEGKTKEAKTTMEVLSVMQYGLFTSRTMDAINQTDMTIFSDGKLSWNKNESIKMVTGALDKTIKFGIQGIGYAATATANKIRRIGRTFDHSGKINDKSEARKTELEQQKADFNAEKAQKEAEYDADIRAQEAVRVATGIRDLNASKNNLAHGETLENRRKSIFDARQANLKALEQIEDDYLFREDLENKIHTLQHEAMILLNDLQAMPDPTTNQKEIFEADVKKQRLNTISQEIKQNEDQVKAINDTYATAGLTLDAEYNRIHTITPPATQDLYNLTRMKRDNARTAYEAQQNSNNILRQQIDEYETATENINTAQRQKRELQQAANEWDEKNKNDYMELMAYWDFLQSGNTKSLFHLSTKKLQQKMDARQASGKTAMEETYLLWKQQHSYAA